jgi:hypothetical protein
MKAILNKTITTEYNGEFSVITLESIVDYLTNVYEVSISQADFIRKAVDGLTDETNELSSGDKSTLAEYYNETVRNEWK